MAIFRSQTVCIEKWRVSYIFTPSDRIMNRGCGFYHLVNSGASQLLWLSNPRSGSTTLTTTAEPLKLCGHSANMIILTVTDCEPGSFFVPLFYPGILIFKVGKWEPPAEGGSDWELCVTAASPSEQTRDDGDLLGCHFAVLKSSSPHPHIACELPALDVDL